MSRFKIILFGVGAFIAMWLWKIAVVLGTMYIMYLIGKHFINKKYEYDLEHKKQWR